MRSERQIAEALAARARSLFERGYTFSTGGNVSHRAAGGGLLVEASGTSLGRLGPGDFVRCDETGRAVDASGAAPSKETPLHAAIYRARSEAQAVVHLHAPGAIALSCLATPTDTGNVLPVVTPYAVMRVGRVPLLEYIAPGSARLASRVAEIAGSINAILLQNHGLVAYGPTLDHAVDTAEELEQTIRIWLTTRGTARVLEDEELAACRPLFGATIEPGTQRPVLLPGARL